MPYCLQGLFCRDSLEGQGLVPIMLFACLLLLAATTHTELADEISRIPPGEWRYVPVELHQEPARISADFVVQSSSGSVRLLLMHQDDLERMRDDLPHGHLMATPIRRAGRITDKYHRQGDLVVVADNREGSETATVHLRVWVDFEGGKGPEITRLSRSRQVMVISISLAVFFGIVTYSGRRLLRAVNR